MCFPVLLSTFSQADYHAREREFFLRDPEETPLLFVTDAKKRSRSRDKHFNPNIPRNIAKTQFEKRMSRGMQKRKYRANAIRKNKHRGSAIPVHANAIRIPTPIPHSRKWTTREKQEYQQLVLFFSLNP